MRACAPRCPGCSCWTPNALARGLAALRADLTDGSWAERHAGLLEQDSLDVGWRLIVTR